MQALDGVTGELYTWVTDDVDFAGAEYPGPNSPEEIAASKPQGDGDGGSPGGSVGQIQVHDTGGVFAGVTGFTREASTLRIATNTRPLEIGNSANVFATAGDVRFSANPSINARDLPNSLNIPIIQVTSSYQLWLGTTSAYGGGTQASDIHVYAANYVEMGVGSTTYALMQSGLFNFYAPTAIAVGASAYATTGTFRLRSTDSIYGRTAANNANVQMMFLTGGDALYVGDTTLGGGATHYVGSGTRFDFYNNATRVASFDSTTYARFTGAVRGDDAVANTTFKRASATWVQNSTADKTLGSTEYGAIVLAPTGTPGGVWNILAPNIADTVYFVDNRGGTPSNVTIKKSGGTGVTIAAGMAARVYHNGTDYVRETADTA